MYKSSVKALQVIMYCHKNIFSNSVNIDNGISADMIYTYTMVTWISQYPVGKWIVFTTSNQLIINLIIVLQYSTISLCNLAKNRIYFVAETKCTIWYTILFVIVTHSIWKSSKSYQNLLASDTLFVDLLYQNVKKFKWQELKI